MVQSVEIKWNTENKYCHKFCQSCPVCRMLRWKCWRKPALHMKVCDISAVWSIREDTLMGKTQINGVIHTLNSSLEETTIVVCFSGNCNFHWSWPFSSHTLKQKLCLKSREVSYTDKWRKKKNKIMMILVWGLTYVLAKWINFLISMYPLLCIECVSGGQWLFSPLV